MYKNLLIALITALVSYFLTYRLLLSATTHLQLPQTISDPLEELESDMAVAAISRRVIKKVLAIEQSEVKCHVSQHTSG